MILSIIIPVFNEEKTVKQLIEKVDKVKLPTGIKKEIIVVDDGSSDQTPLILKKITPKNLTIISQPKNLGKGAAVRAGFKYARGDILAIQDADLEYNPQDLARLIKPILANQVMVVYGTRLKNFPFRLWGKNKTPHPTHFLGNKFLTTLTNCLYFSNLSDMETCYKIFKGEVIRNLNLKSMRFDIEPELTAKILKQGYKISEQPIKVKPRSFAEGKKINWKDGFAAIKALLVYRFVD